MKRILGIICGLSLLTGCADMPTEPPKPIPTFITSEKAIDSNLCKFTEVSEQRDQAPDRLDFSYFPPANESAYFLPHSGTWKIGLIFLDWSDMAGTDGDKKYYAEQAELLSAWYEESSNAKIKINWRISESWNRLPGKSRDYYTPDNTDGSDESRQPKEQNLLDLAVQATDQGFDYTELDVVIYAIPRGNVVFTSGSQGFESNNFPGSSRATLVKSKEKTIGNWILSGSKFMDDKNRSPAFIHWAHEMGHMMGLTGHRTPSNPPNNKNYYQNPMSGIGLYSDQWSVLRAVEGWNAWMLGWLDDSEVRCVDAESMTDDIFEINENRSNDSGPKMLVIRTGKDSGLVIESRLFHKEMDNNTRMAQAGKYDGVVMYQMDSTKPMSEGSAVALVPRSTDEMWDNGKWPSEAEVFTDIYFKEGDVANFSGLLVEVVSAQGSRNFVKVTRKL